MTAVLVIVGFWGFIGACSIAHNLRRIADAIEKQNEHYGIGKSKVLSILDVDEKDAA